VSRCFSHRVPRCLLSASSGGRLKILPECFRCERHWNRSQWPPMGGLQHTLSSFCHKLPGASYGRDLSLPDSTEGTVRPVTDRKHRRPSVVHAASSR
jgi:hypothetical protein